MNRINRVIVAVDFSGQSNAAVTRALSIASPLGIPVHFLHVEEPAGAGEGGPQDPSTSEKLEVLARQAAALGVYSTSEVLQGEPQAISRNSQVDPAHDLLVMGTRGVGGIHHVLGSVADRSIRESACVVLVVGEDEAQAARPIRNIVVATDLSESAHDAFEWALEMAHRLDARIEVLHAITPQIEVPGPYGVPASEKTLSEHRERSNVYLAKAEAQMRAAGVRGATFVVHGTPDVAIADHMASSDDQLAVFGGSSRAWLAQTLTGSIAYKTLLARPCSVAVVKQS